MPRCPNCGRETLRTQDWACQWCGQPLLSGSYKMIPKTYHELQEERAGYVRPEIEEAEEEEVAAPEPEVYPEEIPQPPEVEPKPAPRMEPPPKPAPEPKQRKAPPQPTPPPPPPPEPQPEISAEPEAAPEAPAAPEPVIELPAPETPAAAAPVAKEPEPAVKPPQVPEPEPAPPVETAPPPPPAANLEPEKSGMIVTTVDDLAAAFARDRAAANDKLMDKVLRITGTVEKVFVKDHLDIFYIVLTGTRGPNSWQVRCTFGREQGPALTRLTVGQAETVQGRYAGYEKNIILKECVLVR